MRGFVFGIAVTVAVRLLGWETVTGALGWADHAARETYAHAEEQASRVRAVVQRHAPERGRR